MPWLGLAIGAGVGILKSELVDRPKEERDRTLAAETQRLSPWTGLKADKVKEADMLGSALTYGGQGAVIEQNLQNAKSQEKLADAQVDWLNHGGSPIYSQAIHGTGRFGPMSPNASWLGQDQGAPPPFYMGYTPRPSGMGF